MGEIATSTITTIGRGSSKSGMENSLNSPHLWFLSSRRRFSLKKKARRCRMSERRIEFRRSFRRFDGGREPAGSENRMMTSRIEGRNTGRCEGHLLQLTLRRRKA